MPFLCLHILISLIHVPYKVSRVSLLCIEGLEWNEERRRDGIESNRQQIVLNLELPVIYDTDRVERWAWARARAGGRFLAGVHFLSSFPGEIWSPPVHVQGYVV